MKYTEIKIGDKAIVEHTITEKDISKFVDLTGDDNKLHISREYAKTTEFRTPVVHGMLGASFISTLIGTKLPGDGALWFSQTLDFLRPVRINDSISVEAEVISKNDKANSIELKTIIYNQYKQIVTSGVAKVKVIEPQEEIVDKKQQSQIENKVALVLGASGGLGSQIALKLADDGFDIILHYFSNNSKVNEIKSLIEEKGGQAITVKANLLVEDEVDLLIGKVLRYYSAVHAFVNASTVKIPAIKLLDVKYSEIQSHLDINVKSSFHIIQKLLPSMISLKYGKIVFISSQYVDAPNTELIHYIIGKSALEGFAKSLSIELAPHKINVNIVSPSMIDTDLVADVPAKVKMLTEAKTPLKRLCTISDVAEAVAFLLSDKSSFITGQTLRLNGGQIVL